MSDNRGVSSYIDEMEHTIKGTRYVPSWNEDLKKLNHYRWVRNQISHEPNCTEANMCEPDDALWLDNFYERIMNRTDPLALYRKATSVQKYNSTPQPKQIYHTPKSHEYDYQPPENNHIGISFFIAVFALLGILLWLVSKL